MNRKLWIALLCCLLAALFCCPAMAECNHNYTQTEEDVDYDNPIYTSNGASGHTVGYDVYTYPVCEICGNRASTSQHGEKTDGEEPHEFENGVCSKCGYKCPHDDLDSWEGYSDANFTEIAGDDTYHEITGYKCTYHECYVCGYYWEEAESTKTTETEKHYYIDGTCENCGHKNTCKHPNAEENGKGVYNATFKDTGSDKTHEATGTPYTDYWCEDCQSQYTVTGEGTATIEENHWYEEDGVCEACGHKNACKHENIEPAREYDWYDIEYEDVGSNAYHIFKGMKVVCDYCTDCETYLRETEESSHFEEEQQHSYNSKGVCEDCGHVNTCKHENASTSIYISNENAKYEVVDGRLHKITGEKVKETWCPDCESVISMTKMGKDSSIENHWYEEGSDKCHECGYKNTCKHEHVETYTALWYDGATFEEIPDDDIQHNMTANATRDKYCLDCNMTLSEEPLGVKTEKRMHEYKNGVCVECGHKNTCKHENTETQIIFPEGETVTNLGAKGHKLSGPMYESVYCTACYEELSRTLIDENGSNIEDHNFRNGACVRCGYKQLEEEEAATASAEEPAPTKELVYEPVDENTEVSGVKVSDELTMEEALEQIGAALDEEDVTVEIPGIDQVLSEEEMEKFNQLSVRERLMVALSALGFQDMIQAALEENPDMLSADALALMDDIAARVDALSEEEKAALMKLLEELFVKDTVEIDGEVYTCYCIDLVITRDGEKTYQRFAFRQNDEGQWVLARIDIGEYK